MDRRGVNDRSVRRELHQMREEWIMNLSDMSMVVVKTRQYEEWHAYDVMHIHRGTMSDVCIGKDKTQPCMAYNV